MDDENRGTAFDTYFWEWVNVFVCRELISSDDDIMTWKRFPCYCPVYGAFDLGLAVSVPLPIVTGIFVLLWFQSHLA